MPKRHNRQTYRMVRRCLLGLLKQIPPEKYGVVRSNIKRIIEAAENSDQYDPYERPQVSARHERPRLRNRIREAAGWIVCAKCTAQVLAAWWWF